MLRATSGLTACGQVHVLRTHFAVFPSLFGSLCNRIAEEIQVSLNPFPKDGSVVRECVKS